MCESGLNGYPRESKTLTTSIYLPSVHNFTKISIMVLLLWVTGCGR